MVMCVCALGVMPLIGCSETAGDGGSGGSVGDRGTGGMGTGGMGGTGGTIPRECTQSGAFEFVHPTDSGRSVQDCITADVCLTRGDARSLFNAAVSPEEVAGNILEEPIGTQWALSDCAAAQPGGFKTFVDALQLL